MVPNGPDVPASVPWHHIRPEPSGQPHVLAAGRPAADALTGGYHVAFGTGAGLAAAALVLAAVLLRCPGAARRRNESAGQATPEVPAVRVTR